MMHNTVLTIDDDQVFCQLVKRGLERHDYEVIIANDETSALQQAKTHPLDFVLLDLRLGDASGIQLIEPLLEISPQSQIIVMTGYASLTTAVQAIKLGAVNYLAKPVDIPTLLKTLEKPEATEEVTQTPQEELSPTSLKRLEWEHIQRILHENDGNISATARQLNMHRRTLQRKLQKKPSD
ncbi:MAG: response regulator [Gammaproteobacteria bacterium]|nr:response regulator [Gammaproteobacteria bacterium]